METVTYRKETSPPDDVWWAWDCPTCKDVGISMTDLAGETEVTCGQCGEVFRPV